MRSDASAMSLVRTANGNLVQASGGKVTASQQSMARQLGLSKTRVNELLRELEAAGRVKLHTSRSGTTVALAA
jgi:biotin operon repressor